MIEILLLFLSDVFLDVLGLEIQDLREAAPEEEVFGLPGAVLQDGLGDVDHEDCLWVEGFGVVAGEDALVAAMDHVSGEQHQLLVDTRAMIVLAQSLPLAEDAQPRSVDPAYVLLPGDELISRVHMGEGDIG